MLFISFDYDVQKQPIVIDREGVAAAASGKSGGFLAREWGSDSTRQLHQVSFDMHEELSKELNITSFRRLDTLSVNGNMKGTNIASWLDRNAVSKLMDSATAQVTPYELTDKLLSAAILKGAEFIRGTVTGVKLQNGKVAAVNIKDQDSIPTDNVVVCLGPWSGVFCEDFLGIPFPMEGVKSTSLLYSNLDEVKKEPFALFCEEDNNGCHLELYPR